MPTQFTRMSNRPYKSQTASAERRMSATDSASNAMPAASYPASVRLAANRSAASALRPLTTTRAPAPARPQAMASPMPP